MQQRVNIRLELNVNAILVHRDTVDQEFQILFVQFVLLQDFVEDFQHRSGHTVQADYIVAMIRIQRQLRL